ncbi:MAG TPA: hypothetical protein VKD22_14920 [Ramlibacter sp.]|nr:hypothetical protein [Ramlibacter sp.]
MKAPDLARSRKSTVSFGVAALLAVTAAAAQVVTTGTPGTASGTTWIDTSGNYQHEVQSCISGRTQEDRATCLREARNAQAERKRGRLEIPGAQYQANARARCNALAGEDKAACEARMMGYGETSGSVAGGGVLREIETVVVPPGQDSVTIRPKTPAPVVIVPEQK